MDVKERRARIATVMERRLKVRMCFFRPDLMGIKIWHTMISILSKL